MLPLDENKEPMAKISEVVNDRDVESDRGKYY